MPFALGIRRLGVKRRRRVVSPAQSSGPERSVSTTERLTEPPAEVAGAHALYDSRRLSPMFNLTLESEVMTSHTKIAVIYFAASLTLTSLSPAALITAVELLMCGIWLTVIAGWECSVLAGWEYDTATRWAGAVTAGWERSCADILVVWDCAGREDACESILWGAHRADA